jgi:putative beta-lysine N-acetyltransferase
MFASTIKLQRRSCKIAVAPLSPRSRVVHDRSNERLKLFGAHPAHLAELPALRSLHGLGKVTAYARAGHRQQWEALGFRQEGSIRGFFRDGTDALLWAAYPQPQRGEERDKHLHAACLALALSKDLLGKTQLPSGYASEIVDAEHAAEAAALLRQVFPVYPSSLSNLHVEGLIRSGSNVFRCIRNAAQEMVAVASGEVDLIRRNAEMTDCATRPDQRGRGLMAYILRQLEDDLRTRLQIVDLYTLARAQETGMNCVFRKLGYNFHGRLINNCRMPSGWESMHIWCKRSSDC